MYKLELGANWIHGVVGNPVFPLAKQHDLLRPFSFARQSHRRSGFMVVAEQMTVPERLWKFVASRYSDILKDAEGLYEKVATTGQGSCCIPQGCVTDDANLEDYIKTQFRKTQLNDIPEEEHEVALAVLDNLLLFETTISGCASMSEVSLSQFGSYQELPGGHPGPVVGQGYDKLISVLADKLPESTIVRNAEVVQIQICEKSQKTINGATALGNPGKELMESGGNKTARDSSQLNPATVVQLDVRYHCCKGTPRCANCRQSRDSSHKFDCVILTSSLGYIKRNMHDFFRPPLPIEKQESIEKLGIGTVDKIFLEFEDLDFFPPGVRHLSLARVPGLAVGPRCGFISNR